MMSMIAYACLDRRPVTCPFITTSVSTPSESIEHPIRHLSVLCLFKVCQRFSASSMDLQPIFSFSAVYPVKSTRASSISPPFND